MTAQAAQEGRRRYGNIIDPPKTGFFGLPKKVSNFAVGTIIAAFAAQSIVSMIPVIGAYTLFVSAAIVLFGAFRVWRMTRKGAFGRYAYQEKKLKKNFLKAAKKGLTKYLPGPSSNLPDGSCRAPGPLSGTRCDDYEDSLHHTFGMLWDQHRRMGTVFFSVAAPGPQLFDQSDIDRMVSEWALFQSESGLQSSIVQVAASVVTTRDTGQRLPNALAVHRATAGDEPVPAAARETMNEVLEMENRQIPRIEHVVSLTFSGQSAPEQGLPARSREQVAEEVSTVVDGFKRVLEGASSGATRLMTSQDITDHFYAGFNPGQSDAIDRARMTDGGTGLRWEEAGPTYAEAHKDFYEHSNFFSKTFQQWRPPQALFLEDSLRTLLEPDLGIERKRVTILYRPMTPDKSQQEAMSAVLDSSFDKNQRGRKASSVSKATERKARQTEAELANGAVLVPFSLMVTITTEDPAKFPRMVAETRRKASTGVHIAIREATWTHDSAFLLALAAGLVPEDFEMRGL
ncbi:SCO6880 family protein [Rothia kristinae]|uniref:SCO6880 family protein n=1 Tax=Rothia kristinae TaxID=37923 RepID=UPI00119D9412|nr:SCO6880 family protein [Rothia kristinae]